MKATRKAIITILLCCLAMQVGAQKTDRQEKQRLKDQRELETILTTPVQHHYKFWDNMFFGGSIGMNYSLSEYVRQEKFFNMLRPQIDFWFGKHINKAFALRAGLFVMSQQASIPQDVQTLMKDYKGYEPYNFGMLGAKIDAMYNLNRLFTAYRYNEPFRFWAVAGLDGYRTLGFQSKVKNWTYYPIDHRGKWLGGAHFGIEAQLRQGDHYSLTLSALWHRTTGSYNGQPLKNGGDRNYLALNIGFVYRFTNSKGEIGYHNCKHNENYYFDEMNRRIDKYYAKRDENYPNLNDSIIVFPLHYSYLTPLQKNKLDRWIKQLEKNPDMQLRIDTYSDGDESPVYNQFRAENRRERIIEYIKKQNATLVQRISITQHAEASPVPSEHEWSRAGIISTIK